MKKIGGVFAFKVKDGPSGKEATWFVDVKNGKGCVHNDTGEKAERLCEHDLKSSSLLVSNIMDSEMTPRSHFRC